MKEREYDWIYHGDIAVDPEVAAVMIHLWNGSPRKQAVVGLMNCVAIIGFIGFEERGIASITRTALTGNLADRTQTLSTIHRVVNGPFLQMALKIEKPRLTFATPSGDPQKKEHHHQFSAFTGAWPPLLIAR